MTGDHFMATLCRLDVFLLFTFLNIISNSRFIGTNIDVNEVSSSLNIDNAMAFEQDDAGTKAMFRKERRSRKAYYARIEEANMEMNACMAAPSAAEMSEEVIEELYEKRLERRKNANKGYFNV